MKKVRIKEKNLLLLRGEVLRLQLILDVHQSKHSLKPAQIAWQFLNWGNGIRILRSVFSKGKNTPLKTGVSVLLAVVFLFKKYK